LATSGGRRGEKEPANVSPVELSSREVQGPILDVSIRETDLESVEEDAPGVSSGSCLDARLYQSAVFPGALVPWGVFI